MPVTRSATRASAPAPAPAPAPPVVKAKRALKRKTEAQPDLEEQKPAAEDKPKRSKTSKSSRSKKVEEPPRPLLPPSAEELVPLPAKLTFSLEDAKNHLIQADSRFKDVFARLPCKPFERMERVQPFRTLCSSILGQQISWLAARAIEHKFLRLFFPELPEKPDDEYWAKSRHEMFPTAYQVATMDIATLRTAGLSGRKAEYVRDLATRFADGRLTNQKLLDANDEELFELLTAVYGIGKWTVEMFAIFSLRRPDILPVGDLGVQRGLLRWVLSLHNPQFRIEISPKKLPDPTEDPRKTDDKAKSKSKPKSKPTKSRKKVKEEPIAAELDSDDDAGLEDDELPVLNGAADAADRLERTATPPPPDASSVLPAAAATASDVLGTPGPSRRTETIVGLTPGALGLPSLPPPLTPSVAQILERAPDAPPPLPLPADLTVATLKSRLGGKEKIKGAILTPAEMEALTEPWKPYRSLGVYFMWALAEEKTSP